MARVFQRAFGMGLVTLMQQRRRDVFQHLEIVRIA